MSRVAVVTGAAGGIGSATCEVLGSYGWEVVPVDRKPIDHPRAVQVDIADAAALTALLGELDEVAALVNNAALQLFKPLIETTTEEWDAVAAVNIRAAFVCIRALHPQLVRSRGAVVNVSSVHAHASSSSISAYAATKGGLAAFTRAAAVELAEDGVRVNAVLPGAIDTPALREGFSRRDDAEASLIARTPLKRLGDPREVGEMIAFLVDPDRSGFVTGQEFVVDGGVLARLSSE